MLHITVQLRMQLSLPGVKAGIRSTELASCPLIRQPPSLAKSIPLQLAHIVRCAPPNVPWTIGWQVNERFTTWSAVDRAALVRQMAVESSGWTVEEFNGRYQQLLAVLPDLDKAKPNLSPAVLLGALQDPRYLAEKLIRIKAVMPNTNVGVMLMMHPPLLSLSTEIILQGYQNAQAALGETAAEEVMQWYPALLEEAVLVHALKEMKRLVPHLLKSSTPKQWIHLLGAVVRTDAILGPSSTWDPSTCSWRD